MCNLVGVQVLKTAAHKLAQRCCAFLNIEAVNKIISKCISNRENLAPFKDKYALVSCLLKHCLSRRSV